MLLFKSLKTANNGTLESALEGERMDKKLLNFLTCETNTIETSVIISREKTTSGQEFIHITFGDKERYTFWHNTSGDKDGKPKSMGGKKPYVMLMINRMAELQDQGIKNIEEMMGFLVLLSNNIEWNTGRIINKRSKRPLKIDGLRKKYSNGNSKFANTMKTLNANGLLVHKPEGYFISTDLIKKGGR